MIFSENISNITTALASFQEEMKNTPVTADNPFYKSKYTPLDEIIDRAKPILAKNGLSVVQSPCCLNGDIGVITTIFHKSGEYIQSEPFYLKPVKNDPQQAGGAITYARRYSLAAMLNIASDPDDDGNEASGKTSKAPKVNCSVCGAEITNAVTVEKTTEKYGAPHCSKCASDRFYKDQGKLNV